MSEDERYEPRLGQQERQAHILGLLARQTLASLNDIQAATGASVATTRRDLDELAAEGLIERTRGGARQSPQNSSLDEAFTRRQHRHARAKGAIAEATADLVSDGASLFLNDGSTALALAQERVTRNLSLWIATCALNIAELLGRDSGIEVVVIGGSLRQTSFGTIGPLATNAVRQLHADIAFLGCDGIHLSTGAQSNSIYDAEVAQAMATHADRAVVIADSSKLGNQARGLIAPWSEIDAWITDTLDPEIRNRLEQIGTAVTASE